NSTLTIEEFHAKLQEATNFPLRPFVIPFLKVGAPAWAWRDSHCARMAKQTPAQYLAQHEQLLLDANASSPIDSSELLLEVGESGKRRTPDRTKENGLDRDPLHPEHLSKRPCTMSPAQRYSPSNGLSHPPNGLGHPPAGPPLPHQRSTLELAQPGTPRIPPAQRWAPQRPGCLQQSPLPIPAVAPQLLNCIMDMVEKTRRSLTVLRRCQEGGGDTTALMARTKDSFLLLVHPGALPAEKHFQALTQLHRLQNVDAHRDFVPRPLSGYMPEEIWRKAEEAVNEVKRQAMSELQKAVSDAERKAHELITTERAKMERALAEAKRQASEDALTVINQQEDSSESCWNCGRKASETCSGGNTARYCGSFCQHKDWEKHHHVCGQ
ncbi:Protein CBFA2T3, partial [Corvus brachyrhynchos]